MNLFSYMIGVMTLVSITLIFFENATLLRTSKINAHSFMFPKYNLGLDMQYRINNNSNFTFTFNPDFGQVESDPADINLTAYETYFKDKRPFFIEDIDIFETLTLSKTYNKVV